MPNIRHGVNIFRWHGFLQPQKFVGFKLFGDSLSGGGIVAAMHVASQVHLLRNGRAHMVNPAHHAINFPIAGGPVDLVEAGGVGCVIQVDLHRGEALLPDPGKLAV